MTDPTPADFKGLARPALRALAGHGCASLEDLARSSEAEIARLHGMGPRAMGLLQQRMAQRGLSFAGKP
jgi:hypothetical protein